MCGIAGCLFAGPAQRGLSIVAVMSERLSSRGPDDAGAWGDEQGRAFLGHRRLSIIDVSANGRQPMRSNGGRYVVAFNGEIYNHLEMRAELEEAGACAPWRGHSDTETLLAAFERWGVEPTLDRAVGMFAIALWDTAARTLHLARDRFGEKPLYYGWVGRDFVFGSELKALRAFPGFSNPVCREALGLYMRFLYVPSPHSIFRGVYKLEPGCVLSIDTSAEPISGDPPRPPTARRGLALRRWWSLGATVEAGARRLFDNEDEAVRALEDRLREAIRFQSLADVPVGAFLSGGVDSSTIVALMQRQSTRRVRTFTVGFEDAGFDEAPHARAVARHLGTEHAELFVTAAEARAIIPRLPAMYDEPFADSSQIPTHLVCRAAREQVVVALSGDAGDELFGGYNRYFWAPRIWRRLAWLPYPARSALAASLAAAPMAGWEVLNGPINALLPGSRGVARLGEKAQKLASRLHGARDLDDLYCNLVSEWQARSNVLRHDSARDSEPPIPLSDVLPAAGMEHGQLRMMYRDCMSYLPDDILCKVDRAAMSIGLETRAPFLDHRVAEIAWRLPLDMKIRNGQGKWALRRVLDKYVPRALIERPKSGFGIPLDQWLRGPLRDWAESLLEESRLEREGYFDAAPIRRVWREHLGGRRDRTAKLWSVLIFQNWLEANG